MWNILLNEDEAMIADSVREFLSAELPLERLRPNAKPSEGDAMRCAMAQLGWFSVGLPEEAGGSGLGLIEEMLIAREFGRYVASPSFLAIMLAGHIALEAGDICQAQQLASGDASLGLALLTERNDNTASAQVFDWREDELFVGLSSEGIGLFPSDALTNPQIEECTDDSLTLHSGKVDRGNAIHWLSSDFSPTWARARVMLAAALCGLADHACELTVEYAKIREQFGKPIGSFQAVKHRSADMGVRSRLAWYQTNVACLKTQSGTTDRNLQLDCAILLAAEAAHENARASVQLHGGIGFQAECDVHWFAKRAHVYDQMTGGRARTARKVLAYESA